MRKRNTFVTKFQVTHKSVFLAGYETLVTKKRILTNNFVTQHRQNRSRRGPAIKHFYYIRPIEATEIKDVK